jgi:hypothetical protein
MLMNDLAYGIMAKDMAGGRGLLRNARGFPPAHHGAGERMPIMAVKQNLAKASDKEKAAAPPPDYPVEGEKRRPDFVARCKQAPGSDYWMTIGAAWSYRNGEPGFSVRLNAVPIDWDGTFLLMPPLSNGD